MNDSEDRFQDMTETVKEKRRHNEYTSIAKEARY